LEIPSDNGTIGWIYAFPPHRAHGATSEPQPKEPHPCHRISPTRSCSSPAPAPGSAKPPPSPSPARGAAVVLGARREDRLAALAERIRSEGGKAVYRATDVTSPADNQALVDLATSTFGGLDIAFNNAGTEGLGPRPLTDDTEENFDSIYDINVKGVWLAMRAQIPALRARGSGSIINTTSGAGRQGFGNFSTYASSKFAVEGLTRSVAVELAPEHIRVNSIAPGPIQTDMLDRATGGDTSIFETLVPIGRLGTVDEIAKAVLFIASDDASYITAQSIGVDGGFIH
jgi:NAD(P)-dependent dehydrogenase (short-subunit alcohol dehydrogenase family)